MDISELAKSVKINCEIHEIRERTTRFKAFRKDMEVMFAALDNGDVEAYTKVRKLYDRKELNMTISFIGDIGDENRLKELIKEMKPYKDKINELYRKGEGHKVEVRNTFRSYYKDEPTIRDTRYLETCEVRAGSRQKRNDLHYQLAILQRDHEKDVIPYDIVIDMLQKGIEEFNSKNLVSLTDEQETQARMKYEMFLEQLGEYKNKKPKLDDKGIRKSIEELMEKEEEYTRYIDTYFNLVNDNYKKLKKASSVVMLTCNACRGEGKLHSDTSYYSECSNCLGYGKLRLASSMPCKICNGKSTIPTNYGVTDCLECLEGRCY